MSSPQAHSLKPILALAGACLFAGSCLGAIAVSAFIKNRIDGDAKLLHIAQSKVEMLTIAVQRQGETVASLATAPWANTGSTTQEHITQIEAAPMTCQLDLELSKPIRSTPTRAPQPKQQATQMAAQPRLQTPQPSPTTPAARTQVATAPTAPINPHEVSKAKNNNSIEAIQGSKIGVSRIGSDAVIMQSGTKVSIGERFTSGEKLLGVDTETGQIITDQRTILLL